MTGHNILDALGQDDSKDEASETQEAKAGDNFEPGHFPDKTRICSETDFKETETGKYKNKNGC